MIRPATPDDIPAIAALIREFAGYEHRTTELALDESRLRDHLFGAHPYAHALVADDADAGVVGFALYFFDYTTILTRPGIWLEDLFVTSTHRRRGHGKALLTCLAAIALEHDCARLEWNVADRNEPSIAFYRSLGATPISSDSTAFRLAGDTLAAVASA